MKETQILMSKPVYLGLSILDLSKTVMYIIRIQTALLFMLKQMIFTKILAI